MLARIGRRPPGRVPGRPDIENFKAELQSLAFGNFKPLSETKIQILYIGSTQQTFFGVAIRSLRSDGEGAGVEPLIRRLRKSAIRVARNIGAVTKETAAGPRASHLIVSGSIVTIDAKRSTGRQCVDAACLPTSQHPVCGTK